MKINSITTTKNGIQIEAEDEGHTISHFYQFDFPRSPGIQETAWMVDTQIKNGIIAPAATIKTMTHFANHLTIIGLKTLRIGCRYQIRRKISSSLAVKYRTTLFNPSY